MLIMSLTQYRECINCKKLYTLICLHFSPSLAEKPCERCGSVDYEIVILDIVSARNPFCHTGSSDSRMEDRPC